MTGILLFHQIINLYLIIKYIIDIWFNMSQSSYNCIICAEEFLEEEMQSVSLSKVNTTRFKVCQTCLDMSDPANDYKAAKEIILSYFKSPLDQDILEVFDNSEVKED